MKKEQYNTPGLKNWLVAAIFCFMFISLRSDALSETGANSSYQEDGCCCGGCKDEGDLTAVSLDDITNLAINNSLDIQIAKFDAYMERTSLKKIRSIFDTFLSANVSFMRDRREQPTIILGTESKEHSFSVGLEKKLPTGTTVSFDATGTKQRTDSVFSSFNPYNEALAGVTLNQELGRNFFGMADRAKIKITKLDIENSEFTSLDDIEDILFEAQKAYWMLALKDKEFAIADDMLSEAEKLYDVYVKKTDIGLVEKGEFLGIEALVKERSNSVILARAAREIAKNDLFFILNKEDYQRDFIATDSLDTALKDIILHDELSVAVATRRDYQSMKNELKINEIDISVNKNALWPEIDLEASFKRNNLHADRSHAWDGIPGENADEIFVGLSIKFPLENRESRAELERVNFQKEQLLFELKKIERSILKDLTNSVAKLNALARSTAIHRDIVGLHRQKLDFQVKRLNSGRSDSDTLIRYEEDLFKAQLAFATALYEYKVALVELELTKNTLLDRYWQEPL
jgi:outer membrane protein